MQQKQHTCITIGDLQFKHPMDFRVTYGWKETAKTPGMTICVIFTMVSWTTLCKTTDHLTELTNQSLEKTRQRKLAVKWGCIFREPTGYDYKSKFCPRTNWFKYHPSVIIHVAHETSIWFLNELHSFIPVVYCCGALMCRPPSQTNY